MGWTNEKSINTNRQTEQPHLFNEPFYYMSNY